ncbi:AraC family transcriptional regulator [Cohnella abietis]|uniref:HTH araC/xylS-type domain-containing protein n=1 Tax=Cohnella abietis TaxID=2507935 RepID=A0A3T1D4X1_9BACL|nr:AraC family transcriptional regulator [Cohnella abietis]BBI33025.1 hypothetical protein KCTCHS21_24240 [Cohnella abietis]
MDAPVFPTLTDTDSKLPVYLTSIGHWGNQERTKRPEGFPDYQWLQVVSGTGELIVGGQQYIVKAGQGFFLFPHESHSYHSLTEPWELYWVSFNGSAMSTLLLHQADVTQSGVYTVTDPDILLTHIRSIYTIASTGRPFVSLECSKLLYSFMLDLVKSVWSKTPSTAQSYMKLHPVIQYIEANVNRPITIDEMADCIEVSAQYLCQLFKTTMKMRPMEYVNRERINKSKEWMFRDPTLRMQEIAHLVGFDSPSYFSSVFKKVAGMSPEQFKRFHGIRI